MVALTLIYLALIVRMPCLSYQGLPSRWAASRYDYYAVPQRSRAEIRAAEVRWRESVGAARSEVRGAKRFSWRLMGAELASAVTLRRRFAGVVFVGDSQVREVAWAALRLLAEGRPLQYAMRPGVRFLPLCFNMSAPVFELGGSDGKRALRKIYDLDGQCAPRGIGKYGFTASCGTGARTCTIHSPLDMRTQSEVCAQVYRPHDNEAAHLSVSPRACDGFFVAYHARLGAGPLDVASLPPCLRARALGEGDGPPVLWVVNGGSLSELMTCDPRRWEPPSTVLRGVPPSVTRNLVWQPGGAGFVLPRGAACANESMADVAESEQGWLRQHGIRQYDYHSLALEFAPLMADGRHFTYYFSAQQDSPHYLLAVPSPTTLMRSKTPLTTYFLLAGSHSHAAHPQTGPISGSTAKVSCALCRSGVQRHLPRARAPRRPTRPAGGNRPAAVHLPSWHTFDREGGGS